MTEQFAVQINGTTYTRENLHELADNPHVDADTRTGGVRNDITGDVHGVRIQAADIRGEIRLG